MKIIVVHAIVNFICDKQSDMLIVSNALGMIVARTALESGVTRRT
jgi:hypothetical protein